MVTETPKWQFGGRAQYEIGPFAFGVQAKHVGSRFATDVNDVKVKGYNIVDLDARIGRGLHRPQEGLHPAQPAEPVRQLLLRQHVDADQCGRQSELRGGQPADVVGDAQHRALRQPRVKRGRRLTFAWGAVFL